MKTRYLKMCSYALIFISLVGLSLVPLVASDSPRVPRILSKVQANGNAFYIRDKDANISNMAVNKYVPPNQWLELEKGSKGACTNFATIKYNMLKDVSGFQVRVLRYTVSNSQGMQAGHAVAIVQQENVPGFFILDNAYNQVFWRASLESFGDYHAGTPGQMRARWVNIKNHTIAVRALAIKAQQHIDQAGGLDAYIKQNMEKVK